MDKASRTSMCWKKTKAYKNGNIIYLDANYWYLSGGGLVSTVNMADEVLKDVKW